MQHSADYFTNKQRIARIADLKRIQTQLAAMQQRDFWDYPAKHFLEELRKQLGVIQEQQFAAFGKLAANATE